jgi:hypothetical protein
MFFAQAMKKHLILLKMYWRKYANFFPALISILVVMNAPKRDGRLAQSVKKG